MAVPPGFGDIYWVLQKLRALRAVTGRQMCVHVKHDPKHTCADFLRMFDMVDEVVASNRVPGASVANFPHRNSDPARYCTLNGCQGIHGFDYCLYPNFILDAGGHIEDFLPGLITEYGVRPMESAVPPPHPEWARRPIIYPSGVKPNMAFHGGKWTLADWVDVAAGLDNPVIVGSPAADDMLYARTLSEFLSSAGIKFTNLCGQTGVKELVSLILSAPVVVGLNAGIPILSSAWGIPTVMLWASSDFPIEGCHSHHTNMKHCWFRPGTRPIHYRALSYGSPYTNAESVAAAVQEVLL